MGYYAVENLVQGNTGVVICRVDGKYIAVELEEALNRPKKFNEKMYQISQVLAI